MFNQNNPCERNWHVELPLNPELKPLLYKMEVSNVVGFALNGVIAHNQLEAGSMSNAAEPLVNAKIQNAKLWYGHPTVQPWISGIAIAPTWVRTRTTSQSPRTRTLDLQWMDFISMDLLQILIQLSMLVL